MTDGKHYVLGFCITPKGAVLIQKAKRWGGYVWNGIGGKIEPNETPLQAMVREFWEEAGVLTLDTDWTQLLTLSGYEYGDIHKPWNMVVFMMCTDDMSAFVHLPRRMNEGLVGVEKGITDGMFDSTAAWLLPMCYDLFRHGITLSAPLPAMKEMEHAG